MVPAFGGTDALQWCVQKDHDSPSRYQGYLKSALARISAVPGKGGMAPLVKSALGATPDFYHLLLGFLGQFSVQSVSVETSFTNTRSPEIAGCVHVSSSATV